MDEKNGRQLARRGLPGACIDFGEQQRTSDSRLDCHFDAPREDFSPHIKKMGLPEARIDFGISERDSIWLPM